MSHLGNLRIGYNKEYNNEDSNYFLFDLSSPELCDISYIENKHRHTASSFWTTFKTIIGLISSSVDVCICYGTSPSNVELEKVIQDIKEDGIANADEYFDGHTLEVNGVTMWYLEPFDISGIISFSLCRIITEYKISLLESSKKKSLDTFVKKRARDIECDTLIDSVTNAIEIIELGEEEEKVELSIDKIINSMNNVSITNKRSK